METQSTRQDAPPRPSVSLGSKRDGRWIGNSAMAPPILENACFVPEAGRSHIVVGGADGGQWDTGIGIQCPGRPGHWQETQNSEGERGNGQETDLNFERLLLCNLGATGLARCAVRRLVVVAGGWPRLRCALTLSWLIERPTAHPLPTPTQKNQRALDRGIGCTTGGPMSHQDKVRTVWLPGLAICAPPAALHHTTMGLRSIPSVAASSLYQRLPPSADS